VRREKESLPLGMYSLVSRVHFKADTPKGEPLEMGTRIIQSAKRKFQGEKLVWS
jgi:hypothetical protein